MLQKASPAGVRRDPRAPRRRAPHGDDHRRGRAVRPAVRAAVRHLIGAELEERDGRYTGFMSAPPLVGEARAAWLKRYATDNDIDLRHSYRLRRLVLRSAAAAGRGQPGGRGARLGAVPARASAPLADRGMGDVQGHAQGALPEAGGALMTTLALEYFRSAPRYVGARTVGTKVPGLLVRPPCAAAPRQPEGPRAAERPRGLGAREAAPLGHLRQRPVDDRRPLQLLLLAARVDAVRPRPRGRRRAARRLRRPVRRHACRDGQRARRAPPVARSRRAPTARPATPTAATGSRSAT